MKKNNLKIKCLFILGVILAGCATPKNTDRNTQVNYSNCFAAKQTRMDTLTCQYGSSAERNKRETIQSED